jgi:hypothetical protein
MMVSTDVAVRSDKSCLVTRAIQHAQCLPPLTFGPISHYEMSECALQKPFHARFAFNTCRFAPYSDAAAAM